MSKHSGPGEGPLQKGGGYFQVPDLVFDLELTANEKLVLIYFMRRADREGRSFPSVERICRDCGFGSKNTARKAMNSLIEAGLIRRVAVPGRSYNFFISKELRRVIEDAKGRSARKTNGSPEPSLHVTDLSRSVTEASATRSEYDSPCSNDDPPGGQNMTPKEYTVEGSSSKEDTVVKEDAREKTKRAREEACASSSQPSRLDDNSVTLLDVANHLDSLSPEERRRFDAEAFRLGKPGEPDPRENLWQKRLLRVRYLQRLREGGG